MILNSGKTCFFDVVVNEVLRQYNGLGQLTTEFQASAGAVNVLTTPKVQYAYTEWLLVLIIAEWFR